MLDFSCQQIRNQRVENEAGATYSEVARWVLLGILSIGLLVAYCWNQKEILDIRYQIEELRTQNSQMKDDNAALRAEFNTLTNPDRIAEKARELGLISSNRPEVRIIHSQPQPPDNLVAGGWVDRLPSNE